MIVAGTTKSEESFEDKEIGHDDRRLGVTGAGEFKTEFEGEYMRDSSPVKVEIQEVCRLSTVCWFGLLLMTGAG